MKKDFIQKNYEQLKTKEKIWFIGDTHFGHYNILEYCKRPFSSIEEMDRKLINNWNQTVSKTEKVFMLGDFCLGPKERIVEIGQQLNGRKTLILGNHEGASLKTYYDAGFEYISKYPILFKNYFVLSHQPQEVEDNLINIHAHMHNKPDSLPYTSRTFCTSVELINYKPIEFNDILKILHYCEVVEND